MHVHLVTQGKCQTITSQIKYMVRKKVNQISNVKSFTIVLAINKSFLLEHILNDDGEGMLDY